MAPRLRSADQIAPLLAEQIGELATALLGDRNRRLSSRREWRWGRKGSLSVALGGGRIGYWFDHEVGVGGDALALIQRKQRCSFPDALAWASNWLGAPPAAGSARSETPICQADDWARLSTALRLWEEARSAHGTVVSSYLHSRGVRLPRCATDTIRYHPDLYRPGGTCPGMLALLRDLRTDDACGIHRTFLTHEGARLEKKMLGRSKAAAIKLCPDHDVTSGLGIVEGIETALSILITGWHPVWALGSAGAIRTFPVLPGVQALTIFADHDANRAGEDAAEACAQRWVSSGREVTVVTPNSCDTDFNDCLGGGSR